MMHRLCSRDMRWPQRQIGRSGLRTAAQAVPWRSRPRNRAPLRGSKSIVDIPSSRSRKIKATGNERGFKEKKSHGRNGREEEEGKRGRGKKRKLRPSPDFWRQNGRSSALHKERRKQRGDARDVAMTCKDPARSHSRARVLVRRPPLAPEKS